MNSSSSRSTSASAAVVVTPSACSESHSRMRSLPVVMAADGSSGPICSAHQSRYGQVRHSSCAIGTTIGSGSSGAPVRRAATSATFSRNRCSWSYRSRTDRSADPRVREKVVNCASARSCHTSTCSGSPPPRSSRSVPITAPTSWSSPGWNPHAWSIRV